MDDLPFLRVLFQSLGLFHLSSNVSSASGVSSADVNLSAPLANTSVLPTVLDQSPYCNLQGHGRPPFTCTT